MNRRQSRQPGRQRLASGVRARLQARFAVRPVCLAACLVHAAGAWALPTGSTVTSGTVQVGDPKAGQLLITQTTSKASLDWKSFSIGLGERVSIVQPGSTSILFNRVTGVDPSILLGQLQANGRVFLSNPRGIVFGRDAQVDVGGLVATTLAISDRADAAGRYQLTKGLDAPGAIVMDGTINAPGGTVALVAPTLSVGGTISAARAGLAAASEVLVDVEGDGLVFFNARNDGLDTRLALTGSLLADGGTADLRAVARGSFADTVLNLEGIVRARSIGSREGRIFIDGGAEGITRVAGTLEATGAAAGERGGSVVVLGDKVLIDRGARLDASGSAGGGSVLAGGDFQGKNEDVRNASQTIVADQTLLAADATAAGDGGRVIVWSNVATRYYGAASVRGGATGGNGGLVEVSGKDFLEYSGSAGRSAARGVAGTLLLDPRDLTIASSGANLTAPGVDLPNGNVVGPPASTILLFGVNGTTGAAADSTITALAVQNALGTGAVTLQTSRNMVVNADAPITSTAGNLLTMQAGGNITINAAVSSTGGITLSTADNASSTRNAAGALTIASTGSLNATNAVVTIRNDSGAAPTGTHSIGGSITAGTLALVGNADFVGTPTITLNSGTSTIAGTLGGTGGFTKAGAGTLALSGNNGFSGGTVINAGTVQTSNTNALGSGAVSLADAASSVLELTTGTLTLGSLSGGGTTGGNVKLANGSVLTVGSSNADTTYRGVISGGNASSGLTKTGTGTLTLTNASTYTGPTVVNDGTLQLSTNVAQVGNGTGTITVAANKTLDIIGAASVGNPVTSNGGVVASSSGGGTLTGALTLGADSTVSATGASTLQISGVIGESGGARGLTKQGTGTVLLSGINTYTGATAVNGGTLALSGGAAIADASPVTLANTAGVVLNVQASETLGSLAGGGATGGNVTLGNGAVLTVGGLNTSTTYGGAISGGNGSSGLTKVGTGVLTLSGGNTYAGATTVNGGTLRLQGGSAIGDGSAVTLANTAGVTLDVQASETIGSLDGGGVTGGNVTLGNGVVLTTGGNNGNTVYGGVISGGNTSSGLTKTGTGQMTLTAASTYTGPTLISDATPGTGNTLRLDGAGAVGNGTGRITAAANNTLLLSGGATAANPITLNGGVLGSSTGGGTASGAVTLGATSAVLAGPGTTLTISGDVGDGGSGFGLAKNGTGTAILSGTNGYTGTTTVNAGTLSLAGGAAIANTAQVTLANSAGATLQVQASETIGALSGGGTTGGNITLANGVVLTVGGSNADTSYGGVISGGDASSGLTKTGTGTLTLTNASTYTGPTVVNDGTLQLSSNVAQVGNGAGAITVASGKTLDIIGAASVANPVTSNGGVVASSSGGGTLTGALTLGADSTVSATGASTLQISGAIGESGGARGLTKQGTGTVLLSGINTYTGATAVNGGTLALSGGAAIADASPVTLANTAGVVLNVQASETLGSLAGGGATGGNVTLGNGAVLTVGGLNTSTTYGGAISGGNGSSGLTKVGTGVLTLSGGNTYAGATTVNGGTLRLQGGSAIGDSSAVTLANTAGVVLDVQASETIGSLDGGGATGGNVTLGNGVVLTTGGNNGNTVYGGVISGGNTSSGLTKAGTGQMTLTAASTYTGPTLISDATPGTGNTLRLDGAGAVGNGTGRITAAANNTLLLSGGATAANPITLNGGVLGSSTGGGTASGAITLGATSAVLAGPGTTLTISGNIGDGSSGFGLAKNGTGTAILSGTNGYTGTTTVNAGTLSLDGGAAIANTAQVTLANSAGATLQVQASETIGALSGGGTTGGNITLANGVVLSAGGATDTTYGGVIGGGDASSGLTKVGSGKLTLTAASTYAGPTLISDGTLAIGGTAGDLVNTSLVDNGGVLEFARTNNIDFTRSITGAGIVRQAGAGVLTLSGVNTYTGATELNAGTVAISSATPFGNSSSISFGGGSLRADANNIDLPSPISIGAGGGAVDTNTNTLTLSGAITGTGKLTKNGLGELVLNNPGNTYGGGTDILGGSLSTSTTGKLPDTGTVTVGAGRTLKIGNDDTVGAISLGNGSTLDGTGFTLTAATGTYTLDAVTVIANLGAGTLTVNGSSTLNGSAATTTVNIAAATLTLGSGGRFTAAPAVALQNAASVLALGGAETIGSLDGVAGSTATLGANTLTVNGGGSFAGSIGGAGSTLAKGGSGTLVLSGANTYGGTTIASGGTLQIGAGGTTGTLGNGAVVDNGTLVFNRSDTPGPFSVGNNISGSGVVRQAGSGVLQLSGVNTYTGATELNAGIVAINSATPFGSSSGISFAGGSLRADGGPFTLTSPITINAGGATIDTNGNNLTLSGAITGTGALTKNGNGELALGSGANTNTYAGGTNLVAGTLRTTAADVLPDTGTVAVGAGRTLTLGGNDTVGSLTLGAGSTVAGTNFTLTAADNAYTLPGVTVGANLGAGTLTVTASSTLNGSSAATTVDVNAGTLTLGAAERLADTAAVNLASATSALVLGGAETIGSLAGAAGSTVTLGANTLTAGGNGGNTNFAGVISGAGGLTKAGAGTMTLLADNLYTGATTVNGGTLALAGGGNRLADTGAVVVNAGTLTLASAETIGSLAGSGGTVSLGASALVTGGNNASTQFDGAITGTGALTKNGSGTFTLGGNNTYSGGTTVNTGVLATTAGGNRLADAAPVVLNNTASLSIGGNETIGSLTGAAGTSLLLGTSTLTTGGDNSATAFAGVASGSGGLTKAGTGTFTLGGANTYTGATTIDGGTLATTAGGSRIADTSAVVINAGTLSLGGNETIGSLAGAGGTTVALGGSTLTAGGNNASTTFDGAIGGSGGLTKEGSGVLTLGGVNAYSGVTTVNAGTLATASAERLADGGAVVVNAGTLALGGNETIGSLAGAAGASVTLAGELLTGGNGSSTSYLGNISGAGALTKQGAGIFTLGGSSSYAGATTVSAGKLALAANDVLPNGSAVSVAAVATLDLGAFNDQVGSLTLAGTLDGSGKLTALTYGLQGATVNANLGSGALTQSGGSSALNGTADAGSVDVAAGTLTLGAGARFTPASQAAVTVRTGATLVLGGSESVGSLVLTGTAGNRATLSGAGTLTAATYDLTNGIVAATANLGTGALTSHGSSQLDGTAAVGSVAVADGVLTMGSANRLTASPSLDVAAGALFVLIGDETVSALTGAGTITLGSTLTIGAADASSLFSGDIVASGNLRKVGTGTITLAGNNTYDGSTAIDAGTLATAAAERLPDTTALTVAGGATLVLGGNETIGSLAGAGNVTLNAFTLSAGGDNTSTTFGGVLAGSGGLTKLGSGTLTLGGDNTYSGATTISAGTLATSAAQRIADASALSVAGGATLALGGDETVGSLAGAGNVTLNAFTLTAGGNDSSTTFSGIASGTGGLTKAGTGTLTLAGANTYTGATTVNAGTLATAAADRIADASATTVAGGATLVLGGSETIGSLAGAGNVNLNAFTLSAGGDNTSTTFDGVIAGSGGLTKQGSGTLTLGGDNTYTGATTISAGTLATSAAQRIADASALTVAGGATLTLGGDETIGSLAGAGNVGLNAFTLTAGGNDSSTTFSGIASGTGGLTKAGTGTLTLAGANTYTGATTVNAGTLATAAADRIADASATTVAGGATLVLGGNETIGSLAGAGNVTLNAFTLSAGGDNTSTTFDGVLAGSGGLTKQGSGTLTLGGDNTYTGATTISAGTLATSAAQRIADASALTVAGGATLTLGGDETVGSLAGAGNVGLNTFTLTAGGDNTSTTFSGIASGTGGLTKAGTGTLTLAGANTYTGATTVNAGTLATAGDERIADASALTIAGAGSFSLGGNETVASLAGAGSVALNASTLTAGGSGADTVYAGNIGGAGGLVKQGAGTLTLTGTNSYGGGTTVAAGTLVGNTASLQGNILDNAALVFDQAATGSFGGVVSGSGSLTKRGAGTLTLTAAQTYTGATDVTAGTLATSGADQLADATAVTVGAAGSLSLGGAETVASIVADGAVEIAGSVTTAGVQTYNGTLTFTGSADYALTASAISATNAGNRLGDVALSLVAGSVTLSAGTTGGTWNDLRLGRVTLSGTGRIEAGEVEFSDDISLSGGTLSVIANALPTYAAAFVGSDGKERQVPGGARLAFASNVIEQTGGRIVVGSGALLSLQATQFGSIKLGNAANDFSGGIAALSGPAFDTAWRSNLQSGTGWSGQGHVDIAGAGILVGRPAIESDVITLHLDSLATLPVSGTDNGSRIIARLPYNNLQGTDTSHPGLTLDLSAASLTSPNPFPFGSPNDGQIRIEVGSNALGGENVWNAGFLQALPPNQDTGTKAVYVSGPLSTTGGYRFFYDGAGKQTVIPVIYNGLLPLTPQKAGALSAVQSVSEKARKDRFEEAVRTENVAVRLRSGVIAEVGPGRPATQGSEGAAQPEVCTPASGQLNCGPAR